MRHEDFINQFNHQVLQLDHDRQLELAVAVCKRLFFDYQKFSEIYQWGDPEVLLDAIATCQQARSQKVEKDLIEAKLINIGLNTPDMDDFGDLTSSFALNACTAVYETLQFLIDTQPQHIFQAGICLTDTVDFRIQEDNCLPEETIDEHPLMIQARKFLIEYSGPKPPKGRSIVPGCCMMYLLLLLMSLQSCIGWGDAFAKRENIHGNYYLVEQDNGDFVICFKVGGIYVGRSPSNSQVIAYAMKDTVLAMKIQPHQGDRYFYVINMKKDHDIAKQEEYELTSITLNEYQKSWLAKMHLRFTYVK